MDMKTIALRTTDLLTALQGNPLAMIAMRAAIRGIVGDRQMFTEEQTATFKQHEGELIEMNADMRARIAAIDAQIGPADGTEG